VPEDRRVPGAVERGRRIEIRVDGEPVVAYEGESIAAAILATGRRRLRLTPREQAPRGVYCGMGVCFDCLMVVDGEPNVRTCMTPVRSGCDVRTQVGYGDGGSGE
jgi:predicted molibdopterin-dependent oxidoreductase YjgC